MEDGDFPQQVICLKIMRAYYILHFFFFKPIYDVHKQHIQEITGVFMRNCILNYSSYRNIFPIWALGEYRRLMMFV